MLNKKIEELKKLETRLTEVNTGIENFEAEAEKSLIEGKEHDFNRLSKLKTEKNSLTNLITKLKVIIADLEIKEKKEAKLKLIEQQKKEAEICCQKVNEKIKNGFELIISALNEKIPDVSTLTENYLSAKYNEIQNKLSGKGFFKEVLLKIFPAISINHKYNKHELNNFVNLPADKLNQISEKYL